MDAEQRRAAIAEKINSAPRPRRTGSPPKPFREKPKPDGWRPPDYTTGRPTDYRPQYCQQVVEFMGKGYDLTAFAGSIRASRDAVYNWLAAHPEFNDAVKIGRANRLFFLQEKLLTTKMGVGVTAAIFALKNASPDEWQDRFNTQTEVNVRIEHVSDAKLLEIVGASSPALLEHEATPGDANVTLALPQKPERK